MRLRAMIPFLVVALTAASLPPQLFGQQPGQRDGGQRPGGERGRGGPPGGGIGFFGGGAGTSRLMLLGMPEVQKELELADEQIKEIQKIQEEVRARFRGPGGPPGGRGDGKRGDRTAAPPPADWYFVQAQEQGQQGRGRFGQFQLTDEQRAEMEKRRIDMAREEKAKLAEILLPNQIERLTQIYIQVAGVEALRDEDVAKELGLTEAQTTKIAEVRRANQDARNEQMRELFGGGGDGDAIRAKVEELRKASDAKVLAVLTDDQQKKFEEMKGKPFKLPEGFGRGGFRGRGGPGGGGPGGERGKRGGDNRN